jgi:hypothetical protein
MAKTKKPKLQKTLRRQAWDTFKSGYDRKGMDGEPFDIKSKIGNAILGKDREVGKSKPKGSVTDRIKKSVSSTADRLDKLKKGGSDAVDWVADKVAPTPDKKYDQSQKPELDKQIGMLKGRLRQQSQTPATNVLPADKTAKIQQAINAGKLNKDQYALAGRSIMKYRDQGFDVKPLVVAWLATGKSNLMQSKELEELKQLAGIK